MCADCARHLQILEQVEGGDLVVNSGNESRPKDSAGLTRTLNPVGGLTAALKLAEVRLTPLPTTSPLYPTDATSQVDTNEQIKLHASKPKKEPSSLANPTTYTPVFLRIQPFTSTLPDPTSSETTTDPAPDTHLQFLLYLSDPEHKLVKKTVSQIIPASWMALWEYDDSEERQASGGRKNGEWIEDMIVEALRLSVEIVGQEYVVSRMSWDAVLEAGDAPENAKAEA